MSDTLIEKRDLRKAEKIKLGKQELHWNGAFPKPGTQTTKAVALRNTCYIYPTGKRVIGKPEK